MKQALLLKRTIAYGIDLLMVFCMTSAISISMRWHAAEKFQERTYTEQLVAKAETYTPTDVERVNEEIIRVAYIIPPLCLIVINGLLTGLLGWSLGKRMMGLRVYASGKRKIGWILGVMREAIKFVAFIVAVIGLLWVLYELYFQRTPFYDRWLGVQVRDPFPWGLRIKKGQ